MSRFVKSFDCGLFLDTLTIKLTACEAALMGHWMLLTDSVETLCSCLVFTLHVFKGDNWGVSCFDENLNTGLFLVQCVVTVFLTA